MTDEQTNLLPSMAPYPVPAGDTPEFNYALLDPTVAQSVQSFATKIRGMLHTHLFEVGHALIKVKDTLQHGQFKAWVHAELNMSVRTAENYMNAHRKIEQEKSETISLFPPVAIYALASPNADQDVVAEIILEAEAGNVLPTAEVKRRLSEAAAEKKKAAADAKKTPKALAAEKKKSEKKRKAQQARDQREDAAIAERWQEKDRAARAVADFLWAKLPPADIAELLRLMRNADSYMVDLLMTGMQNGILAIDITTDRIIQGQRLAQQVPEE